MDDKTLREKIGEHLKGVDSAEGKKAKDEFLKICTYLPGAYDDDKAFQALHKDINEKGKEVSKDGEPVSRLFYMALPPNVFTVVATGLKKNCYDDKAQNRIVIEKPFGKDLESCREMMGALKDLWKEEETFRIDHYLGKEMVKNVLVMRFANPIIDQMLNNQLVDNVQITFKEPFGTEGRGGYFDEFGIVRDIQQNRGFLMWVAMCHCPPLLTEQIACTLSQTCRKSSLSSRWIAPSLSQLKTSATKRSRLSRLYLPSRTRMCSLANTRQPKESLATRTTTLSPKTATVRLSQRSRSMSRTSAGRVCRSF